MAACRSFRSAIAALRRRRVNMDVPISLGVTLATGMSMYESFIGGGHAYFDAATSLLFFLLIGRVLDHLMRARARAAASNLARLSAKGGFVVGEAGDLTYVALDAINPGMRLRIVRGRTLPRGRHHRRRGERCGPRPGHRRERSAARGGRFRRRGRHIEPHRPRGHARHASGRESFLAEVMQMMAAAEKGRSSYVRIADRMARIYSPVCPHPCLLLFRWLDAVDRWRLAPVPHRGGGGAHHHLPCALGLAVPVAHVVSGRAPLRQRHSAQGWLGA
jgi:Cu2+-exporting ATPase